MLFLLLSLTVHQPVLGTAFAASASSTLASAAAEGSLPCRAVFRDLDDRGETTEESAPLLVTRVNQTVKQALHFRGRLFALTQDQGSLLAQIFHGPDYSKGVIQRGQPDAAGRFNLAEIDGTRVYRLECGKR